MQVNVKKFDFWRPCDVVMGFLANAFWEALNLMFKITYLNWT